MNYPRVGADKPAAVNRTFPEKGHGSLPEPSRHPLTENASSEQGCACPHRPRHCPSHTWARHPDRPANCRVRPLLREGRLSRQNTGSSFSKSSCRSSLLTSKKTVPGHQTHTRFYTFGVNPAPALSRAAEIRVATVAFKCSKK